MKLTKFGGHQSFYLRDTWVFKALKLIKESGLNLNNTEDAIEQLGIGINMLESLKYWLRAARLVEIKDRKFVLTENAEHILFHDPYCESEGTILLMQYFIATNKSLATTWYWFFNHFVANQFDMDALRHSLCSYVQLKTDNKVKESTLNKDLLCLIKMYQEINYTGNKTPETENPSPFSQYGWIKKENNKFIQESLPAESLDIHIFAYLIYLFWTKYLEKSKVFKLQDLVEKENSPCRIFRFSEQNTFDLIEKITQKTDYLKLSRTGGYTLIYPNDVELSKSLNKYYSL